MYVYRIGGGEPSEHSIQHEPERKYRFLGNLRQSASSQIMLFGSMGLIPRIGLVVDLVWATTLEQNIKQLSYGSSSKWRDYKRVRDQHPFVRIVSIIGAQRVGAFSSLFDVVGVLLGIVAYNRMVYLERDMRNLEISWLHRERLEGVKRGRIRSARCYGIANRLMRLLSATTPFACNLTYIVAKLDAKEWLKDASERPGFIHKEPLDDFLKKKVIQQHISDTTFAVVGGMFQITTAEGLILWSVYQKNQLNTIYNQTLFLFVLSMTVYTIYLACINIENKNLLHKCKKDGSFERARLA